MNLEYKQTTIHKISNNGLLGYELKRVVVILTSVIVVIIAVCMYYNQKSIDTSVVNLNITNMKDAVPKVALTFDDGPSGAYTEILLDGLRERNVKATFFVMGNNIKEHEDIIRRMYNEGHLIGNHTYTHIDLAKTDFETACKEISDTNSYITNITGYTPRFIRPPYGDWNDKLLTETDMSVVLWNVDPEDWKDQNADIVAARVVKNTRNGDIILLHDIFKSSVDAALQIVDQLQDKGYHFVTVDKLNNSKIVHKKK